MSSKLSRKKASTISLILLLSISMFIGLFEIIPFVKAQPIDVGINIGQTTNAGTNYVIKINVYNSTGFNVGNNFYIGGGSLSNNFGDIRFLDSTQSTQLNYWQQTVNSTCSVFWIQIPNNLSTASAIIYMSYGQTSQITTSNGTSTFTLFDDFASDSGTINSTMWSTFGNATIIDNVLVINDNGQSISGIISKSLYNTSYAFMSYGNVSGIADSNGMASGFCNSTTYAFSKSVASVGIGSSVFRIYMGGASFTMNAAADTNNHLFTGGMYNGYAYALIDEGQTNLNFTKKIQYQNGYIPPANVTISSNSNSEEYFQWCAVRPFVYSEPVISPVQTEHIQGGTVSNVVQTNTSESIRFQQKTFYASGRYWLFYIDTDGTYGYVYYTSSSDGTSWTSPTLLPFDNNQIVEKTGENLEVFYANNLVNVFWRGGYYVSGIADSNGTINWNNAHNAQQNVGDAGSHSTYDFFAGVDSSGYMWFSTIGLSNGTTLYIYKSQYNNGTWGTSNVTVPQYVVQNSSVCTNDFFVSLPNNEMYFFFFNATAGQSVYGCLWNGSALSAIQTISTDSVWQDYYATGIACESYARTSVVDSSGNIYLGYMDQSQNIVCYIYNFTTGLWGSQIVIQSNVPNYASPSFSMYKGQLQMLWISSQYSISSETFNGVSWTNNPNILVTEDNNESIPIFTDTTDSGTTAFSGRLNAFSQTLGSDLGLIWITNNTANTFEIKIGLTQTPVDTNSPVYSSLAVSSTIYNQSSSFYCTWTDDIGLSGYTFGSNNTGIWVNQTYSLFSYNPQQVVATLKINDTLGNTVSFEWWANDTANNCANTGIQNFVVTTSGSSYIPPVIGGNNGNSGNNTTPTPVIVYPTPTQIEPLSSTASNGLIVVVVIIIVAAIVSVVHSDNNRKKQSIGYQLKNSKPFGDM